MTEAKIYDLEKRTFEFARSIIKLCERLPRKVINNELIKQLIRSGSSVGANYREANEALGKRDFQHRMRITRKEAKETTYWLLLLLEVNHDFEEDINCLIQESKELRNISTAIINKSNSNIGVL